MKPILDACCGGRMMWHQRERVDVVFMDRRQIATHVFYGKGHMFGVTPDVVGDFRAMPFADDSFRLVVFDPPHVTNASEKSITGLKYGQLDDTWREDLAAGFRECFRVCDPTGFVIFKWSETQTKHSEVIPLAGRKPLFGTRTGKSGNTIWLTFSAENPVAALAAVAA